MVIGGFGTGMGRRADRLSRDAFLDALHDDLMHLYDAEHLRASPLAVACGVDDRFDSATSLRNILIEAIESLRPSDDTPLEARSWFVYEGLSGCYVQQLGQKVVADQLGISVRQLRRELRAATEALADELWRKHCKDIDAQAGRQDPKPPSTSHDELAWLRDVPPDRPVGLAQAVDEVFDLAGPLSTEREVPLVSAIDAALPALAVNSVALTQALLTVLTVAIGQADSGAEIRVSASRSGWDVVVAIETVCGSPDSGQCVLAPDAKANVQLAKEIAMLCGGALTVAEEGKASFGASLSIPALEQVPVLAIDDHPDTLQLIRRFTSGTRYRLLDTRDPDQALWIAARTKPEVIVLDVLMPAVDGWRVLARLREHPITRDLPTIVCTIMAQRDLALSLGASDFIRKPFTRQSLLAALDRQVAPRETVLR